MTPLPGFLSGRGSTACKCGLPVDVATPAPRWSFWRDEVVQAVRPGHKGTAHPSLQVEVEAAGSGNNVKHPRVGRTKPEVSFVGMGGSVACVG